MKQHCSQIGDELLNAYLDDQLDSDERGRILEALRQDQVLAERVCALRQVKELTRHAYSDVALTEPPKERSRFGGSGLWSAAAAISFLMVGAVLGWWGHRALPADVTQVQMMHLEGARPDGVLAAARQTRRVLVHISSNQPERMSSALDTVDRLLHTAQYEQHDLQVEVIVNSDGLDLLRTDTTAHAERIAALAKRFRNVHFLACSKAVERLRREGVQVNLLPEAHVSEPALDLIIKRMRQGWLYVEA